MGLFDGIKNTYKKSEAAAVLQNLLEDLQRSGLFDGPTAPTASFLIDTAWKSKPDIFNGKFGQHPHKLSAVAYTLAISTIPLDKNSALRNSLIIALGKVVQEVEANGSLYPFNRIDDTLLNTARDVFFGAAVEE